MVAQQSAYEGPEIPQAGWHQKTQWDGYQLPLSDNWYCIAALLTGNMTLPREFTACGVFPGSAVAKNPPPANAGDIRGAGSIPGSGRSPGGGHGNPLQYSCLEKPTDRGVWRATVQGATKNQTWLKRQHTRTTLSGKDSPNNSEKPERSVFLGV